MSIEKMNKKCSMTIAGLDPSGGAGIIADCKTFHAHGIYATCVVTAVTAQNPYCVTGIGGDLDLIESEIDEILSVYPIRYIKTGMLYSGDIIKLVSRKIKEYDLRAVVDPVMVSESGGDLTGKSFIEYMNKYLVKNSFIITPNIHEAEKLSNKTITSEQDMISVAEDNTHGTVCIYSSAITSRLIEGYNLYESCKKSNEFIRNSIKYGFNKTPYQFWKNIEF